ncbi:hypothetical protein KSD_20070 [Ktedonobacter sp. SOSP1-85]|uniref:DUF1611 domain-containing protein n=1 Tax=Ktedonobacter sp. SOSP1-85 TaxID=2778367 RepID=UPI001916BCFD|nr:DUF1611 domain-containing protein [Ktedonobacter sp. SOSP1-85]GHO74236.1 hypothetical protein KSD_20070 [Ktedonobacter sp. SOSP1-85]
MRRIVILAEAAFTLHRAKTATGVIRYSKDKVVAVIDSTHAGKNVAQALNVALGEDIPMVRDINEALQYEPDALMIGIAPVGGALPPSWRWQLTTAIEHGLDIISGLHTFISDDEELRTAAEQKGVTIWDVRRPQGQPRVAKFAPHRPGSHTVLMVGSDCSAGKMTVALELERVAAQRDLNGSFLATGQTGIMISNNGLPIDHLISDFVAGMVEEQVLQLAEEHDWVFVEGQGALNHPGYSPVTLGLIHGSAPDAMIFCHLAGAKTIDGYENCPLPSLQRLISINEDAIDWIRQDGKCKVVGLALMTVGMNDEEAQAAIKAAEEETGLPTTDVIRFGAEKLMDALQQHFSTH